MGKFDFHLTSRREITLWFGQNLKEKEKSSVNSAGEK